jgi:outer membrane immunogenic protein
MRALTIAVGLTGLVTSAVAADLPVRPAPPPAPIFSWTGFYFGPHIGGGWANGDAQTVSGPEPGFFDPFRSNLNGTGVVAGGQVGFNWQLAPNWVIGWEGDVSGTTIDKTATQNTATILSVPLIPASSLTLTRNINWLASVRGRIGVSWDRALLYFTGGVAWAGVTFQADLHRPILPDIFAVSVGDTRTGWVIGGGLEYAFENTNWTMRGEFLHYQFDGFSVDAPPFNGFTAQDTLGNFNVNVVRVGFNYKYGDQPRVAARY